LGSGFREIQIVLALVVELELGCWSHVELDQGSVLAANEVDLRI